MARKPSRLPPGAPWAPWSPADTPAPEIAAIKALARGEASPDQQVRALAWILHKVSHADDLPWHPENERWTSFAAGKQFVGKQIQKAIGYDMRLFDNVKSREQPEG